MNRYSMIIQWSDEDQLFLVTIPEFTDLVVMPCTHGTPKNKLSQIVEADVGEGSPISSLIKDNPNKPAPTVNSQKPSQWIVQLTSISK
ncbi:MULTISPECIES: hypothetical protein [Calothrix]|uniref:hypothetical protein n=1 Tax=Calothrix TaxID=1186 RepID=UPI001F557CFD|nr:MULTISPECIES: hypothetical protein [Calothrix]